MYFDDPKGVIDPPPKRSLRAVLTITALAMLLFVLYPAPLVDSALTAAKSITGD